MRRTRRFAEALGLIALSILATGCVSPIGIRIADPREVQRYLTRSALTESEPSDFSLNELRRYDLLAGYEREPEDALAKRHAAAVAEDFPNHALFALSELWFLHAQEDDEREAYAAAAVYARTLLFAEEGRERLDRLDPRERIAADLYNRALTALFRRDEQGMIALAGGAPIQLPFGRVSVSHRPDLLEQDGVELHDLQAVAEIEVRGLRNRYRQPGIGAPLAAKTLPQAGVTQVVPLGPLMRIPLTAVAMIDEPLAGLRSGDLRARAELFQSLDVDTVAVGDRRVPLEAEPTAALAATLAESRFWKAELQIFLGNALGVRRASALFGIRPFQRGRIPVVFVHGTASSPARWADMLNDLLADSRLRHRYEFWLFSYDSGNPIAYSAWKLREALGQAVGRADPEGSDPCARDMVVLGHSQGGLLTKLTAIDSGDIFWNGLSSRPFDEVKLAPDDKEMLRNVTFVKPLPFVTEVIFLATPQRGSYLAGPQIVRRLAEALVRLPSDVVRVSAAAATQVPTGSGDMALRKIPTSIDNMSPGNRFIKALAKIPVSPGVRAHSIISVNDDAPLSSAGDGVVKYESAHVDGVESELIVRSPHSGMQAAPETIEEVRRILLEHSARSACPASPS